MWWTNWTIPKEYTHAEIRDTSDVQSKAMEMFKGRLMYPGEALIQATSLFLKASIFDIKSLPSWYKSRICLIGDAAHAVFTPPLEV
jgi:2-polyprenyl-6-methoxyphenol hydroxylase-like FAD-dependent oxidoreductase